MIEIEDPHGMLDDSKRQALSWALDTAHSRLKEGIADLLSPASALVIDQPSLGLVPVEMEGGDGELWRITNVERPRYNRELVTSTGEVLCWGVMHELAHWHELTLRMQRKIAVPSREVAVLWSEYYAERTTAEAMRRHTPDIWRARMLSHGKALQEEYSPYNRVHRCALSHAIDDSGDDEPEPALMSLAKLYERFPNWNGPREERHLRRFTEWCAANH